MFCQYKSYSAGISDFFANRSYILQSCSVEIICSLTVSFDILFCSAVLLCSADSIYPVTYFCNDLQHVNQKLLFLKHTRHFTPSAVSRCCHVVGSVTPGLRYQPLRANYISVFSAAEHMNMNVLLSTPTSALDIHAQVMNR